MREELFAALDSAIAAGADYADVRVSDGSWEAVHTESFDVTGLDAGQRSSAGVRVRKNGSWGFAAGTDRSSEGLRALAVEAMRSARSAALLLGNELALSPVDAIETHWETPVKVSPFAISVEERAELLFDAERGVRRLPATRRMVGLLSATRSSTYFASSDGSLLSQERHVTGVGCSAMADSSDGSAQRSFPQAGLGQLGLGGLELVQNMGLASWGERAAEEATMLITAPSCPAGVSDIILSGSTTAALLHETIGHFSELDRGWWNPSEVGTRRVASEVVNVVADALQPTGLGTYGFDDEGVPASQWQLVESGILSGLIANRELVGRLNLDPVWCASRAEGAHRAPSVRMPNVSLLPGDSTLDQLISGTTSGLLIDTPLRITLDSTTGSVRCEAEIGWEIGEGRVRQIIARPAFETRIEDLWNRCDAVCDADHYGLWSVPNCKKGLPNQRVATSHGTAPTRFRGIDWIGSWGQSA